MAISGPTPVPQADKDRAQKIREDAEARYSSARGNGTYNTDALQVALAKAYVDAKTKMDALAETSKTGTASQRRAAIAAAWGIDDIAGSNAVDRAAASMSFRDAVDRASKLDTAPQLSESLSQAESNGDELAARAIAQRAYDLGLIDVVQAYVDPRPKAGEAIVALIELDHRARVGVEITDLWAFALNRPAELASLGDSQIRALATDSPLAGRV